jgi:hypothetical protein
MIRLRLRAERSRPTRVESDRRPPGIVTTVAPTAPGSDALMVAGRVRRIYTVTMVTEVSHDGAFGDRRVCSFPDESVHISVLSGSFVTGIAHARMESGPPAAGPICLECLRSQSSKVSSCFRPVDRSHLVHGHRRAAKYRCDLRRSETRFDPICATTQARWECLYVPSVRARPFSRGSRFPEDPT